MQEGNDDGGQAAEIDTRELRIRIRCTDGRDEALTVPGSLSISELKERVREAFNVDSTRQRLIYRGRVLQDADELTDYNIESNHTIHMVLRPQNVPNVDGAPLPPQREVGSGEEENPARRLMMGTLANSIMEDILGTTNAGADQAGIVPFRSY